jgi:hypothetical protein
LSCDVIVWFSVSGQARRAPVDAVQARQRFDHRAINLPPFAGHAIRERRIRHGVTVDVFHDEKRRADDIRVFAQETGLRNGHAAAFERAHDPIFTFDGVRRRQKLARWFASQHEALGRRLDVVGRIRLSAAELSYEKWRAHVDHPGAEIALERAHIELM